MDDRTERRTTLPRGWFATLAGGVLGVLVVGFLGLMISIAAADTYYPGGMEGLVIVFFGVAGGALIGGAVGAGLMLRAFHHDRPFATGFAFVGIEVILVVLLWMVTGLIVGGPVDSNLGVAVLFVVSPIAAAILGRMSTTEERSRGEEG